MAERFGGRFSPRPGPEGSDDTDARRGGDGPLPGTGRSSVPPAGQWRNARRSRTGGRVNALFIAPAPLALLAFGRDPAGMALSLAAFGLLIGAALLTREGIRAQEVYETRRVAKRPALPRKLFGAALTGAGLALAGLVSGGIGAALIFAVLGAALHVAAFGPDPLRDKGVEGSDEYQTSRALDAVAKGEAHLAQMRRDIARTRDPVLVGRVEAFGATAARMFRGIEEDPSDLNGARRYLGVYLQGAREATAKYTELAGRRADAAARDDYLALLDDLEQGFTRHTEAMHRAERSDLEIEIEVLRERLAREGVTSGDKL
ncbi:5-bromo-4-chloroindolyl phosphate hydrolysis family protein [Profundibacterium mesophilum]|uniref:5-bromo-4-chloroindolyl phosphate hydrolysis protein domain containing protein n=1 Tax=Profundibacterium mesophilum KAUST100406-0324 TaxID=1037889 RepID=A0A921NQA1_9RHOB|nr:5-bromo-4-chloroindolyl phosphate hydrolysis family protein [Profundibacterium mesophilum]KAF0675380.1 5-bromo-4-chloroindolyl phosphate hydrolysis protein domain containing protein [Profundibacterium mesophilum KAUST100406-0324]